jgi:transposase-like protein
MTDRYLGVLGVAEALGVSRHAVHKWRSRYPSDSPHPFPEPDVEIDGAPGWAAQRLDEMVQWRDGLPGRGAGGGRPTAARQAYLTQALARGLSRDEADRLLGTMGEEFPEMTEAQVCEFLLEKWRGLDEMDEILARYRQ